jgi:hypothetical protein
MPDSADPVATALEEIRVKPSAEYVSLALDWLAPAEDEPTIRSYLAAVLTRAREQIADFACGERVMTNQEMTRLISAEEHGEDRGEIYLGYVRRLIGVWPAGYGAKAGSEGKGGNG